MTIIRAFGWLRPRCIFLLLPLSVVGVLAAAHRLEAQGVADTATSVQTSFATTAKPFFEKNCMGCHKGDAAPAGLRVDRLTGTLQEQEMETWERVYRRGGEGNKPPAPPPPPPPPCAPPKNAR